jgi:hypothetical protein
MAKKTRTELEAIAGVRLARLESGKGTQEDIDNWRTALKESPDLWRIAGDTAKLTALRLMEDAAGKNQAVHEGMKQGYREIKAGLGYETSPMLEKLLIDAVLLAWLRWSFTEYHYTENARTGQTLAQGDYWDRHLDAAQRRYLRALAALARIRKMNLPAIQINIGDRQVNIAGRA